MESQYAPLIRKVNNTDIRIPESLGTPMYIPNGPECIFKMNSFLGLRHFLREGDAVLDVGCAYGVMGALIAKIVGISGACYSLDANSAATALAEQMIKENGSDDTVSIRNLAVGDAPGNMEFYTVPGMESAEFTRNPKPRLFGTKTAVKVRATTIDEFCAETDISPKCVKIDVGGGECLAVRGAKNTIERARPDFVIETHSLRIELAGGDLAELTHALESAGYELFDMFERDKMSAKQYASAYRQGRTTMLASTRLGDAESIRQEIDDWKGRHFRWAELIKDKYRLYARLNL